MNLQEPGRLFSNSESEDQRTEEDQPLLIITHSGERESERGGRGHKERRRGEKETSVTVLCFSRNLLLSAARREMILWAEISFFRLLPRTRGENQCGADLMCGCVRDDESELQVIHCVLVCYHSSGAGEGTRI